MLWWHQRVRPACAGKGGRFRQNRQKKGIALAGVFLRKIDFSFEPNTFRIARF